MIGDARSFDVTSAPAAALGRAAVHFRRTTSRLWAATQVRLKLASTATRSDILGAAVIPTVRYRDAPKAVEWLTRAFGMQVHRVITDADGAARYAELTVGAGMLMVAPIEDTAFGKLMVQPDEIGGVETQVCYLCVDNAHAHAARAKAAGAVVIIDPDDEVNKGRGYSCRDPEGHVWNFGVYDPWHTPRPPVAAAGWRLHWSLERGRVQRALAAVALLVMAGTLGLQLLPRSDVTAGAAVTAAHALTPAAEAAARPGPEANSERGPDIKSVPQTAASGAPVTVVPVLAKVDAPSIEKAPAGDDDVPPVDWAPLDAAKKAAADARAQLATAHGALAKAQREASDIRAELAELQNAKLAAERAATEARTKLAMLQKSAERARADAAHERARRLALVRAALKRRSVKTGRRRMATWCYSPTGGPTRSAGRLVGFCKS
jgi:uncharacterized glyoxalase superfamily protein PhnB